MIGFLIQFIFLFFLVIFQGSFLGAISPHLFPNALLSAAIAWTLTRGFFAAWPWVVGAGILYDMMSLGTIGISAIALLLFSYGISFVSRRFLVEHRESGMVVAAFFMSIASVTYAPALRIIRHLILGEVWSKEGLMSYFSSIDLVLGVLSNVAILFLVYGIVSRINIALSFYDDRVTVQR